jgi:polyisoprenoid-binding protein YceI
MTTTLSPARPLATGRWRAVPGCTSATFTVRNFGLRHVTGSVPVAEAWVEVDAAGVPRHVRATLDLRAVDTGNARRDADLQKPHLLDTAHCPTLTFAGTPYGSIGGGWTIAGSLAGRCATEVVLDAAVEAVTEREITVSATVRLDRRELGVRAPRLLIGRCLEVVVTATFCAP